MANSKSRISVSTYSIIAAVILGGFLGHSIPELSVKLKIAGDIFLNFLFVLVIPLVVSSMISGISGLGDIRRLGSLGLKTVVFYLATTFLSVLTGIILVNIIAPGKDVNIVRTEFPEISYTITATPLSGGSILRLDGPEGMLPSNILPDNHTIKLIDQEITGQIEAGSKPSNSAVAIEKWTDRSGNRIEPRRTGTGIEIKTKEQRLSPDELLNNFIPRNVFQSMVDENVFPLIIFCLYKPNRTQLQVDDQLLF